MHFQLARLEVAWEAIAKVWFKPGKPVDESAVHGTMRPKLDDRFIMHEYMGSFGGKPLEGIAIYGYHLDLGKIQCAWIDSFHSGGAIIFSEGNKGDNKLAMPGSYAYLTPETEQHRGWRTEIDILNDD